MARMHKIAAAAVIDGPKLVQNRAGVQRKRNALRNYVYIIVGLPFLLLNPCCTCPGCFLGFCRVQCQRQSKCPELDAVICCLTDCHLGVVRSRDRGRVPLAAWDPELCNFV